jgi:hypothetical protein
MIDEREDFIKGDVLSKTFELISLGPAEFHIDVGAVSTEAEKTVSNRDLVRAATAGGRFDPLG